MSVKKGCIGCLKDVDDKINLPSVATICDDCLIPLDALPLQVCTEQKCLNCGGKTNFIGAFTIQQIPFPRPVILYFDCPNPICSEKRITIVMTGCSVRRFKGVF